MILGLACWVISALFALAASYLLHRSLRTDRPALNAATYVFLTILVTTAMTLAFGLMGQLRPWPLGLASLAGLVIFGGVPATRGALAALPAELRSAWLGLREWWAGLPTWVRWLAAIFGLVSLARFTFLILALPPFVWDSLTYHLTNVAYWTQTGRITAFDSPVPRIFNPANYEVFAAWFTVFLHHDAVVEAAGLPAYLLACLSVYALGRSLGLLRWSALLAALAYASTPALLLATTGTKNDPFITAFFLMTLAIVADLALRKDDSPARNASGSVVLLLAALAFGVGTKTYMLLLAPGLLVVGVWAAARGGGLAIWADHTRDFLKRLARGDGAFRLAAWSVLLVALFLGSYWYLRNWALTGNPFYPYGVIVGKGTVREGIDVTFELSARTFRQNWGAFWDRFGDKQRRIVPDLPDTTGWGWVAYALGLPGLLWALLRRREPIIITSVAFLVSFTLLLLTNRLDPWSLRFFTWTPALLSLAIADMIQWFPQRAKAAWFGLRALVMLCLALNVAMTLNYNRFPIEQLAAMLGKPIWEREAASLGTGVPKEYENALTFVPREDLLGYDVGSNGFIYPLFSADFSQRLVYVPFEASWSCEAIARAMEAHDTRWLFVAPEHSDDLKIGQLRMCSDSGTPIRERARGVYVVAEP